MTRNLFFMPDTKARKVVISRVENYRQVECGSFSMCADSSTYFDFKFERPDKSRIEMHKVAINEALELIEKFATKEDFLFACGVFFNFGQIVMLEDLKRMK